VSPAGTSSYRENHGHCQPPQRYMGVCARSARPVASGPGVYTIAYFLKMVMTASPPQHVDARPDLRRDEAPQPGTVAATVKGHALAHVREGAAEEYRRDDAAVTSRVKFVLEDQGIAKILVMRRVRGRECGGGAEEVR